jgi:hypothetical protein
MSLSVASLILSPEEIFEKDWMEVIIENFGNNKIKYDYNKTNELYHFIINNFIKFVKIPIQLIPDIHFFTSCFIYIFPWKFNNSFKPFNNGLLYKNSLNCKFTLANIENKNMFIKVVDVTNTTGSRNPPDYIIMDIMNCILLEILYEKAKADFEMLLTINTVPDIFNNYTLTDFVNKFETSFLSYSTPSHWNYNELMNNKYVYDNFCQIIAPQQPITDYSNICHIYITNAINGKPETLYSLYKQYMQDQQTFLTIFKYLKSLKHVYNYIYYMGFHFGFLHNDLHQGNLLFDTYIEKLTIIDYGRNYIGYFYDNQKIHIDNCVKNYYKILNYKDLYPQKEIPESYKDLINNFEYKNALRSIVKSSNNGYMTHILDIITLTLSTLYYIYLLQNYNHFKNQPTAEIQYTAIFLRLTNLIYFEKVIDRNEYDALKNKNIKISLRNPTINLNQIINIYIITKIAIVNDIANNTENEHDAFIYDGLFYTALLLNYFKVDSDNISEQKNGKIISNSFQINKNKHLVTQDNINNFMIYLNNIHINYPFLSNINIYFKKMSDLNMPIASLSRITGGKYNIEPDISSKIKTTKKKEITKEMQEVIDRLERNDMSPIQPPFHIKDTDINIMNAYEKIFMSNIK